MGQCNLAYDRLYFELESPILDIKILGKTFINGILAKGAIEGEVRQDKK